MLSQFSVTNFKSFKDQMTLDLQGTTISEHIDHLIKEDGDEAYLPISVIYGPNGGGKSNVLEALRCLVYKVSIPISNTIDIRNNTSALIGYPIVPFKFDKESRHNPTEFELFIHSELAEYRYRLHVCHEQIIYESLDRLRFETGRRSALFLRNKSGISLKNELASLKSNPNLSSSLPFLSYLGITYGNNDVVKDVLRWFMSGVDFLNYVNPLLELRYATSNSSEIKRLVLNMIKEMDLDIVDFRIEDLDSKNIEIYTKHIVGNLETELTLSEESSGTRKIFALLPYIARALLEGRTLVVDELDAKIHPTLLKYIIHLFTDLKVNQHGAQLIFTSHDLSTMNSTEFRRDEIWFVAKGNQEDSKLYSLVEFKDRGGQSVRKDARFDKQYLEGRYGADPYLKRFIDWEHVSG